MDWITLKEKVNIVASKYKYVLIVILAGILLMRIPSKAEPSVEQPVTDPVRQVSLAEQLEEILSKIDGVGRVEVLLTESDPERIVYQTDEDRSVDGSVRTDTVIVSGGSRDEDGLIAAVIPPTYLGAIVVCQGADSPSVQFSVIQAVSNVTGIGSDRITVLKMK